MKNNYLKVIRETLESQKDITILSLYEGTLNGYSHEVVAIYINNFKSSLSFINKNESFVCIPIEGYNINLIELGWLLKNIYTQPKNFLLIDSLRKDFDYLVDNDDEYNLYLKIIDLVMDNLPIFLVKGFLIEQIDKLSDGFDFGFIDSSEFHYILNLCQFLIDDNIVSFDVNFLKDYRGLKKDNNLFIKMCYDLDCFKEELISQVKIPKITEAFIRELDDLYIDIQILYASF